MWLEVELMRLEELFGVHQKMGDQKAQKDGYLFGLNHQLGDQKCYSGEVMDGQMQDETGGG